MKRLALIALAGCASFEDPTIVLDLRVIGMETTPPEQILDVDTMKQPTIEEILDQLEPIRVRAYVAEPGRQGPLVWSMSVCVLDEGSRCDPATAIDFAGGVLLDPESNNIGNPCPQEFFEPGGTVCGKLVPDNRIVQMMFAALEEDPTGGLQGIELGIELHVEGAEIGPIAEAFAAKRVGFAPRIPMDRRANNNPTIERLVLGRGAFGSDIQKQHCADNGPIDTVEPGESITLFPEPLEGDKEEYVLPTLDGGSERFTEYLEYQWIATSGNFVDDITGGPPDFFGNVKLDGTEWKAPKSTGDVQIWSIQRDGRYGVRWREACIRVMAP